MLSRPPETPEERDALAGLFNDLLMIAIRQEKPPMPVTQADVRALNRAIDTINGLRNELAAANDIILKHHELLGPVISAESLSSANVAQEGGDSYKTGLGNAYANCIGIVEDFARTKGSDAQLSLSNLLRLLRRAAGQSVRSAITPSQPSAFRLPLAAMNVGKDNPDPRYQWLVCDDNNRVIAPYLSREQAEEMVRSINTPDRDTA